MNISKGGKQRQETAIALDKPSDYVEQIREVTADYQRGLPLLEKIVAVRQEDLAAYQQQQKAQLKQEELSL